MLHYLELIRSNIWLLLIALGNMVCYSMWLPVLQRILKPASGSAVLYGLIQSSGNFMGMIGSAGLGRLSDAHGRKPVLLLTLAMGIAGSVLLNAGYGGTTKVLSSSFYESHPL